MKAKADTKKAMSDIGKNLGRVIPGAILDNPGIIFGQVSQGIKSKIGDIYIPFLALFGL